MKESLKSKLKRVLASFVPQSIKKFIEQEFVSTDYYKYQNVSFSQEGEDLVIDRFLKYQEEGFYIDIGAHHPMRFSNTYRFYLRGWRGINIDAMPGSMKAFNEIKPNDINIEIPISAKTGIETFYIFNETAFNTFSEANANRLIEEQKAILVETCQLQTQTLSKILDDYLPKGIMIDFMSIDIEGLDLSVLKSNDWHRYKPKFILVEAYLEYIYEINEKEIHRYLTSLGYKFVAKTYYTLLYKQD
ncbi:FkbM family methyltransferase [Spirosoma aerolatum]|uniref:FkbM family methyltransferase n=1 Tax=Spirosoma aerolatum TaxID=1211326 RepID=UPI0009ADC737|nr:FkbM family methyltransferase [Spirosoma aerolatum]